LTLSQLSDLRGVRDLDLNLSSGHTAYRRLSLIDLYLYQTSFKSENF